MDTTYALVIIWDQMDFQYPYGEMGSPYAWSCLSQWTILPSPMSPIQTLYICSGFVPMPPPPLQIDEEL